MQRIALPERIHWKQTAREAGFAFHTIEGERYWDERGAYRFSLQQIEQDIEDPTLELHEMAMSIVAEAVNSEEMLTRLAVPRPMWELVRHSWQRGDAHLYGRMDLAYNGHGPAKLYEFNYDTPTSLYEAAFFQWVWLEDQIKAGVLPAHADQFNSIQDKLILAFASLGKALQKPLHLASCEGSTEDLGTVEYLRDCAHQAGLKTHLLHVEDIGWDSKHKEFVDVDNTPIELLFKLYPLEQMFEDGFAKHLTDSPMQLIEPAWKTILSNKGLMPLLWERFPGHPNLLACHFEDAQSAQSPVPTGWVRKRLFSREGANIDMGLTNGDRVSSDGEYGEGPSVLQAIAPLTRFEDEQGVGGYALVGSWVVGDQPAGMGIREDDTLITKDTARFVPHFIDG